MTDHTQSQAPILSAELAAHDAVIGDNWEPTELEAAAIKAIVDDLPYDDREYMQAYVEACLETNHECMHEVKRMRRALAAAPAVPAQEQSEATDQETYALLMNAHPAMRRLADYLAKNLDCDEWTVVEKLWAQAEKINSLTLARYKRELTESQRVYAERGLQIARLEAALTRAAQEQAASCPDGYVLVPKVPTREMLDNIAAFCTGCTDHHASVIYRAMLAAAPTPPAAPQPRELTDSEIIGMAAESGLFGTIPQIISFARQLAAPAQKEGAAPVDDDEPKECWSANEEEYNASTLEELLESNPDLKAGDTVWHGEAVHPEMRELFDADDACEQMGERAYEIAGEHGYDYPNVSEEEMAELDALVHGWIAKHAPPNFWRVENVKAYKLSHDDFPNDPTPIQAEFGPVAPHQEGEAS